MNNCDLKGLRVPACVCELFEVFAGSRSDSSCKFEGKLHRTKYDTSESTKRALDRLFSGSFKLVWVKLVLPLLTSIDYCRNFADASMKNGDVGQLVMKPWRLSIGRTALRCWSLLTDGLELESAQDLKAAIKEEEKACTTQNSRSPAILKTSTELLLPWQPHVIRSSPFFSFKRDRHIVRHHETPHEPGSGATERWVGRSSPEPSRLGIAWQCIAVLSRAFEMQKYVEDVEVACHQGGLRTWGDVQIPTGFSEFARCWLVSMAVSGQIHQIEVSQIWLYVAGQSTCWSCCSCLNLFESVLIGLNLFDAISYGYLRLFKYLMSDLCKRFSRTERQIQLIQNQRHVSVASRHRVSHRPSHYFPGRFGKGLPMQILQALINAVDADLPAKPILRAVREEPTRSKMLLEITSDKWHAYSTYMNNHEHMSNRKNPGNTKYVFDGHWFMEIDGTC